MLFTEEVNGIMYCYVPLSRKGMNYIGRRSLKVLGYTLLLVAKIALLIIKIPWFIAKKIFSTCCQIMSFIGKRLLPFSLKGIKYIARQSFKVVSCISLLVAKIALLIIKIPWFIVKIPWFIVKKLFSTCCQILHPIGKHLLPVMEFIQCSASALLLLVLACNNNFINNKLFTICCAVILGINICICFFTFISITLKKIDTFGCCKYCDDMDMFMFSGMLWGFISMGCYINQDEINLKFILSFAIVCTSLIEATLIRKIH